MCGGQRILVVSWLSGTETRFINVLLLLNHAVNVHLFNVSVSKEGDRLTVSSPVTVVQI